MASLADLKKKNQKPTVSIALMSIAPKRGMMRQEENYAPEQAQDEEVVDAEEEAAPTSMETNTEDTEPMEDTTKEEEPEAAKMEDAEEDYACSHCREYEMLIGKSIALYMKHKDDPEDSEQA